MTSAPTPSTASTNSMWPHVAAISSGDCPRSFRSATTVARSSFFVAPNNDLRVSTSPHKANSWMVLGGSSSSSGSPAVWQDPRNESCAHNKANYDVWSRETGPSAENGMVPAPRSAAVEHATLRYITLHLLERAHSRKIYRRQDPQKLFSRDKQATLNVQFRLLASESLDKHGTQSKQKRTGPEEFRRGSSLTMMQTPTQILCRN